MRGKRAIIISMTVSIFLLWLMLGINFVSTSDYSPNAEIMLDVVNWTIISDVSRTYEVEVEGYITNPNEFPVYNVTIFLTLNVDVIFQTITVPQTYEYNIYVGAMDGNETVQINEFFIIGGNGRTHNLKDFSYYVEWYTPQSLVINSSSIDVIPFTLNGEQVNTPFNETLGQDSYDIVLPETYFLDGLEYVFLGWSDGLTDTERTIILETNVNLTAYYSAKPIAQFVISPSELIVEEEVIFDATKSYDIDGKIQSYLWDFGDGKTSTGITTTHSYTTEGTYTVTLTVIDNDGLIDTITYITVDVIPEFSILTLVVTIIIAALTIMMYRKRLE